MIQNVKSILEASGSSLDRVIKANVSESNRGYNYTNIAFQEWHINGARLSLFTWIGTMRSSMRSTSNTFLTARTSVEVSGLPKPADLEIEVIALAD